MENNIESIFSQEEIEQAAGIHGLFIRTMYGEYSNKSSFIAGASFVNEVSTKICTDFVQWILKNPKDFQATNKDGVLVGVDLVEYSISELLTEFLNQRNS